MERYRRSEVGKEVEQELLPNEVRVTSKGKIKTYITLAMGLIDEKACRSVVVSGKGNAVSKAVTVAEMIKTKLEENAGGNVAIDQDTQIFDVEAQDVWDPIDDQEELDPIVVTRHLPCIRITISILM